MLGVNASQPRQLKNLWVRTGVTLHRSPTLRKRALNDESTSSHVSLCCVTLVFLESLCQCELLSSAHQCQFPSAMHHYEKGGELRDDATCL